MMCAPSAHTEPGVESMDVCAGSGFCLLALPSDLLLTVLQQSPIGAQELCRLECCATALKSAVDESVWRGAFLAARRCNALREPDNWKQEFARRDAWSRGWRQLIACTHMPLPHMRLGGHTQKLRRFALKIMSSAPVAPTPQYGTHIVDQRGVIAGSHPSIASALARAKPFDVVLLEPGTYTERLRLEKPVEIVGRGELGSCVLVGTDGPTVEVRSQALVPSHYLLIAGADGRVSFHVPAAAVLEAHRAEPPASLAPRRPRAA